MKKLLVPTILACVVAALAPSSSTSAPGLPEAPSTGSSSGITGQPSVPNPGHERPPKNPFIPYDIGDPLAAWSYEDLTPEEKAVADRGSNLGTWATTHDAYGNAGAELVARAAAEAAALQLGVDHLGTIGVVP